VVTQKQQKPGNHGGRAIIATHGVKGDYGRTRLGPGRGLV